ncbi:MAG: host attachment protein [Planctomycetota bacterium]
MGKLQKAWFLVADREHARLVEASRTPHGRCHLDVHGEFRPQWLESEHARPSPLGGKDGHSYASVGHEDEERLHRFVNELGDWVTGCVKQHGIESMSVYCSAQVLGEIRRRWDKSLQSIAEPKELNIAHLPTPELQSHQAIKKLVEVD